MYTVMLTGYVLTAALISAIYAAMGNDFKDGMLKAVPGFVGLLINYVGCTITLYALGII